MRKILFALLLAITAVSARADVGEFALGVQTVYGTDSKAPGIGLHLKYNFRYHLRTNWSTNYNFKRHGVQSVDSNFDFNYLFYIGEKVRIYPLAGLMARVWFWKDRYTIGTEEYADSDSDGRFGVNGGGGIDYVINDHFIVNAEAKYQYLKDADQVHCSIGVSYVF